MGMPVRVVFKDALGRKDKQGNSYLELLLRAGVSREEGPDVRRLRRRNRHDQVRTRSRSEAFPEIGARPRSWRSTTRASRSRTWRRSTAANLYQANAMVGQRILQEIGQTGIPVVNTANACATGSTAFRDAWMAVKAGEYESRSRSASSRWARGLLGGGGRRQRHPEGRTARLGHDARGVRPGRAWSTPGSTARRFEQFAKVAEKNHHHSTLNPLAQYQIETPLER